MKDAVFHGPTPVFGSEMTDLTILALAVPALICLFAGLRSDTAIFTAVVSGAAVVLLQHPF